MADVFLSYKSEDRHHVHALATRLEAAGYSVWWDTSLVAGETFRSKILEELTAASAVIVVWSAASVKSEWVIDEADRAARAKKLVPLRLQGLDLTTIPPPFPQTHVVPIDEWSLVLRALIAANALPSRLPDRNQRNSSAFTDHGPAAERDWTTHNLDASDDAEIIRSYIAKWQSNEPLWVARANQRLRQLENHAIKTAGAARIMVRNLEGADMERVIVPGAGARPSGQFIDAKGPLMVVVPAGKVVVPISSVVAEVKYPFAVSAAPICNRDFEAYRGALPSGWHPFDPLPAHSGLVEPYLNWLRATTGKPYRFMTKSEFVYIRLSTSSTVVSGSIIFEASRPSINTPTAEWGIIGSEMDAWRTEEGWTGGEPGGWFRVARSI